MTGTIAPPDSEFAVVRGEILSGDGLSFAEAARLLPRLRGGRPISAATVWRWALKGIELPSGQRLRLAAVRIGAHFSTSRAALNRFIGGQNPELDPESAPTPPRSLGRRQRASQAADAELRRRGC
jgi:hypothetical protein